MAAIRRLARCWDLLVLGTLVPRCGSGLAFFFAATKKTASPSGCRSQTILHATSKNTTPPHPLWLRSDAATGTGVVEFCFLTYIHLFSAYPVCQECVGSTRTDM
eukprot:TRINITY_DN31850_c0_g1_i1.p8 TRINITY_DN31850_c0_g1~~TRINITY_DN31850_c0_g1_i1.p8  ORF type:complete len:104 (+),score=2.75 TRINITY_DN31850_c0_g1_i1:1463-1774(+)